MREAGFTFFGGKMPDNALGAVIVAGWYPDPADDSSARWWDGAEWSSTTRQRQPVAPTPVAPDAPAQHNRYFSPVPVNSSATLPPIDPYRPLKRRDDSQGFVSMGAKPTVQFSPTLAYTGSVWAIATMPVWSTLLVLGLILGLGELYTTFLVILTSVLIFIATIVFAIHDQNVMLNSLHPTAASPWWMLLSPLFYLISRGVHVSRTQRQGWAPLVVFLICSLMPATVVLAFGALYAFFLTLIG